ncbi:hypothetical protein JOD82_002010 [Paenibacillus sp. 1182]|uniref:hypothetical protein n=1 Tax=Paenibacillus sp. 1182 TaxID=2806565 RepID=UPI001AE20368|nr:hypothetical protein [Paenibacillus sp. 1182]MBP1308990.1 hypothetical protein [Paenibacillus sp. 1182]
MRLLLINAHRVNEILLDCLYKNDEIKDGKPVIPCVGVEGVMNWLGFHPNRLASYKEEVTTMISNLPSEIQTLNGVSFLNVCQDTNGEQWTGHHKTCDELIMLGIGLKLLEYVLPKEMWSLCPGGLPMIRIKHS